MIFLTTPRNGSDVLFLSYANGSVKHRNRQRGRNYDRNRAEVDLKPGDEVLFHQPAVDVQPGMSRKLTRPWQGPYKIAEQSNGSNLVFRIQSLSNKDDVQAVSVQRLRRCQRLSLLSDGESAGGSGYPSI